MSLCASGAVATLGLLPWAASQPGSEPRDGKLALVGVDCRSCLEMVALRRSDFRLGFFLLGQALLKAWAELCAIFLLGRALFLRGGTGPREGCRGPPAAGSSWPSTGVNSVCPHWAQQKPREGARQGATEGESQCPCPPSPGLGPSHLRVPPSAGLEQVLCAILLCPSEGSASGLPAWQPTASLRLATGVLPWAPLPF